MHIQVLGQQNGIGESFEGVAESQLAVAAGGCFRAAGLSAGGSKDRRIAGGAGQRNGRHGRYSTRSGGYGEAATQAIVAGAALMSRNAVHGGLHVVYRRQDGNISWIDGGPARVARG